MIKMPIIGWLLLIGVTIYANAVQIWQFKKIRRLKEQLRESHESSQNEEIENLREMIIEKNEEIENLRETLDGYSDEISKQMRQISNNRKEIQLQIQEMQQNYKTIEFQQQKVDLLSSRYPYFQDVLRKLAKATIENGELLKKINGMGEKEKALALNLEEKEED